MKRFPTEVAQRLAHYVYRLIDPRNGETFYVGKGTDDRVFKHADGDKVAVDKAEGETTADLKMERIRQIHLVQMQVQHVIHRHGMNAKTAFEVEAALIDAYPGLTNKAGGHENAQRGAMHADELIAEFSAVDIDVDRLGIPLIEISVNRTAMKFDLYRATRFAWKADLKRARKAELVVAVTSGIVRGVFIPTYWGQVTRENFPELAEEAEEPNRIGFSGEIAPEEMQQELVGNRMPPRKRGAANPIRYFNY